MINFQSRILYCDAHCAAVNKVVGEAAEGAAKGMIDLPRLLADELSLAHYPAVLPENEVLALPTAVHRLDVPVSGCMVFARSRSALKFLNEAFKNNTVEKHYWAIVESSPNTALFSENEYAELVHWIQFDPHNNKSIAYNEPGLRISRHSGRKKAILRCRLIGSSINYSFLEIDLVTGRHHQIRAQLAAIGLHIKGDLKYGARRSEPGGGIRLHARSVSFPDPADNGTLISVQAVPPLQDSLWLAFEENIK